MKKIAVIWILLLPLLGFSQKQFVVFFDFNKDFPNPSSILELNQWIANHRNIEITKLQGFCDSIDTKDYNRKLAERRIESVRELLEKSGLKFSQVLEKVAFGKEFKQSKVQAENRKVTIFYTEAAPVVPENELIKKIKESKVGETIKLPNLYFFNNSARIVPKSETTLYDLLCALEENPNIKIEIQGHICCQTVEDRNDVSTARARAIYNYLLRNKIDRKRMKFKGYGVSRPIHRIPERTEAEADENRRVEILIIEK
ncbi:OmpA family protein [Flavobacterium sedimenticola]|uniref:OmpA family protein n=1 Tax=Flavobacterium sedimenticola TaxID=3043286 RepID=A0ABT6XTA6_9FLAO|nr:OmpA family protein [Flavobacterium sedimenticola]MDI9258217.1 OmpA family protein [Flavobacterium sedimenticola]